MPGRLAVCMEEITLASYAKVNLTLEVIGQRPDAYHDIDSVATTIDLADELQCARAPEGTIDLEVSGLAVPVGPDNLVHRACREFFRETRASGGVRCRLTKRIPVQAGLGGGSSNAAAAIVALDRIYGCDLGPQRLAQIAERVGSDAPMFVYGGTVRMRGRGGLIDILPDAPQLDLLIIKPSVGVSTAWAYKELDTRGSRAFRGASDRAEEAIRSADRDGLVRSMCNDFDAVIGQAFGDVRTAKRLLEEEGAQAVVLAGSGSGVFGVFASRQEVLSAAERLRARSHYALPARTVSRQVCMAARLP